MNRKSLTSMASLGMLGLLIISSCTIPVAPIVSDPDTPSILIPVEPVSVVLDVEGPIRLNEPVSVTITVLPNVDLPGVDAVLNVPSSTVDILGPSQWKIGDLIANQASQVTSTLVFRAEGQYQVIAGVHNWQGVDRSTSIRLAVTAEGGVINPTPLPGGTPVPAHAASGESGQPTQTQMAAP